MNPEGAMQPLSDPVLDEVAKAVGACLRRVVAKVERS
jgi:hypothetical protein